MDILHLQKAGLYPNFSSSVPLCAKPSCLIDWNFCLIILPHFLATYSSWVTDVMNLMCIIEILSLDEYCSFGSINLLNLSMLLCVSDTSALNSISQWVCLAFINHSSDGGCVSCPIHKYPCHKYRRSTS